MPDMYNIMVQKKLSEDFNIEPEGINTPFRDQLASKINDLVQRDFNTLILLLYRIDVSESKLKETLEKNPGHNAGSLIADLIIERQLQKIKARENAGMNPPAGDNEAW
jgi:hypothetical protein